MWTQKNQAKGTVCCVWGKNSWAKRPEREKKRMTQSPVACFLHSLEEENDPNKLGMSHCSGSLSLVPKAPESILPGTC